jgi:FlaA1/EpsC-like NDP-sugar epimerase
LRFNLDIPAYYFSGLSGTLLWVVPLQAAVFVAFGLYRGLWRFASLPDLQRIVLAVSVAAVLVPLVLVMFRVQTVVPRSVLLLDPLLLVLFMGGSRFAYRVWKEHRLYAVFATAGQPVLVLGAGESGARLTKELARSREWFVAGLLDDDPAKHGRLIHNVKVLGPLDEMAHWARHFGVKNAIIAMPGADSTVLRRVARLCASNGVRALSVPAYEDVINGTLSVSTVHEVGLDDLLGRDPISLDSPELVEWLGRRVVLVTGAGGSIGSELCRQIARAGPARIVLVELSEFALYRIDEELSQRFPGIALSLYVADVKNERRVRDIMEQERPSVVFHAAAYKHVPLMEHANAWEAVRNNALGTLVIAKASVECGAQKFVLVSTDKAVNPTNVMGASKRMAEMVCQGLQNGGTSFVIVRFGNVLGSAGSVVPKFREQIERGGPLTITHPEITRYFMSIPEAAQLVLQAGFIGAGGQILVLDMGEPVRIIDLARDLIRLSGRNPDEIPIEFIGLRPGEKLYEEPLADAEATLPTLHPKVRVAQARGFSSKQMSELTVWLRQEKLLEDADVRDNLRRWIPEYLPPAAIEQEAETSEPLPLA